MRKGKINSHPENSTLTEYCEGGPYRVVMGDGHFFSETKIFIFNEASVSKAKTSENVIEFDM